MEANFPIIEFPTAQAPLDAQGFHQSFQPDQVEDYLTFFKQFGFVVIDNVLNRDEVNTSVSEVWDEVESFDWSPYNPDYIGNKSDRNDSTTWADTHFPTSREGFFGLVITEGKQAFKNRYTIFKNLLSYEKLWVSIDRYGIMRPTKQVPEGKLPANQFRTEAVDPSGTAALKDHDEWRTTPSWVHWDLNPWVWSLTKEGNPYKWDEDFIQENNGTSNQGLPKLQGFLNFVDNRVGDGGFSCVPGFHKVLREYAEKTVDSNYAKSYASEYVFVPVPDCTHVTCLE